MADKQSYKVNSPVIHDGKPYAVGKTIELTADEAESLGEAIAKTDIDVGKTADSTKTEPDRDSVNNPDHVPDADKLINLNDATADEIAAVKYVTKAQATAITKSRPHASVETARPQGLSDEQWKEIAPLFKV